MIFGIKYPTKVDIPLNKETKPNRKSSKSGDRDETINHIMSDCRKLAQKEYKTMNDWVGMMIL